MIYIDSDSISSSIGAVISLTFSFYYLISYLIVKKERFHLILSFFMLSFLIYLGGYSLYSSLSHPADVLFWTRICYAGGAMITYTSYLLSCEIIQKHSKVLGRIILLGVGLLILSMFLPYEIYFTDALKIGRSHSTVMKGPLFPYMLLTILLMDFLLIIRFVIGIWQNRKDFQFVLPILFGLVFWFLEAVFDSVFGALLATMDMKMSLGPIIMTFSLALYSGKISESRNRELIKIKEENRQIYNSLIYDKLSALYSRQYFLEILEQRVAMKSREEVADCVMFFDIDNFKSVNDELGHARGDDLIAFMGEALRQNSRKSDICARYGGDEFLMLLENCPLPEARKIALTIQDKFARGLVKLLGDWEGTGDVSLSIGIITSGDWPGDPMEIIKGADAAMYKAKRSGRGKIMEFSSQGEF